MGEGNRRKELLAIAIKINQADYNVNLWFAGRIQKRAEGR
jgi:hypothetical protein